MGAERFDRLSDGRLLPPPDPAGGFDLRECYRRANFISRGSAGAWSSWCRMASIPAAEVRRIVASDAPDLGRLAVLLDRLEDAWRLGTVAPPPRDPAILYRATLIALRCADAISAARAALGLPALTDVSVAPEWLAGAA